MSRMGRCPKITHHRTREAAYESSPTASQIFLGHEIKKYIGRHASVLDIGWLAAPRWSAQKESAGNCERRLGKESSGKESQRSTASLRPLPGDGPALVVLENRRKRLRPAARILVNQEQNRFRIGDHVTRLVSGRAEQRGCIPKQQRACQALAVCIG